MIRSRLLYLFLLLVHLGITPAGMYTCACFIPNQPILDQDNLNDIPQQSQSMKPDVVVDAIASFLALSFSFFVTLAVAKRSTICLAFNVFWFRPYEFKIPPPTPPPYVA